MTQIFKMDKIGLNDNIYNEGNILKMPDFDVFSVWNVRNGKLPRSRGKRKNGHYTRKKNRK